MVGIVTVSSGNRLLSLASAVGPRVSQAFCELATRFKREKCVIRVGAIGAEKSTKLVVMVVVLAP